MALYIETLTTRQIENLSTLQIESLLVEVPLIVEQLTTAQVENLIVEQIENLIPTPVIFPIISGVCLGNGGNTFPVPSEKLTGYEAL